MISVSTLSGYKLKTKFTVNISPSSVNPIISWGDGTFSNTATASHIFNNTGCYNLVVSNCFTTSAFPLSVFRGEFLENALNITYTGRLSAFAGCEKSFSINLSSTEPSATIYLYSSGSNSLPYNSTSRTFWSHLDPEWQFNDIHGNPINEITIQGTPIYNLSSQLLGYSALSTVSYIDDYPGHTNLFFTMKIDDHNSRVYSSLYYAVSSQTPLRLRISADGINDINKTQWADKNIPYTISVVGKECETIVYNASGYVAKLSVAEGCYGIGSNNYFSFLSAINLKDVNCFPTGGYSVTNLFVPSSAIPINYSISDYSEASCNVNVEEIEYERVRNSPLNVVLSAYAVVNVNGKQYSLSGISTPFNVYPLENIHKYYKLGEEKTVYDIIKRYSHFDLEQYSTFNSYLSAIAGEEGLNFYGDVQNIVKNTADIDTCSIHSLYDIAKKMDEPIDTFGLSFPSELLRFINDFSIPLPKLIGTRCSCNTNFNCQNCCGKNICSMCGFDKKSNLGNSLTLNSLVSANQIILIKEDGSDIFEFYHNNQNTTIRNLTGIPFDIKPTTSFCFYEWDQSKQNNPVHGLINYKDERNFLQKSLSANTDWYSENGVIEEVFNFILTKNLLDE
jgi:hypothetical protein